MKTFLSAKRYGALLGIAAFAVIASISFYGCDEKATATPSPSSPQVNAANPVAAGQYIIKISGCNDCHTPGFMQNSKVPESEWLTGVPVGWRGPWGTSYGANLRVALQAYPTKESWITAIRAREGRPPMPWVTLHSMSDSDLGAVYAYVRSLGPKGEAMPQAVPPDQEPKGPYIDLMPKNLPPRPM